MNADIIKEAKRKAIHVAGIAVIPLDFYFGFAVPGILVVILSCLYILSEHMRIRERHFPMVQKITRLAMRDGIGKKTDYAPLFLAAGVLLPLAIFPAPISYCAVIAVALGDGFASLAGKSFGGHRLAFKKTLEGTGAGFAAAFVGCLFFVSPGLALAASGLAMSVEFMPLGKFDNIAIPLAVGIVLSFLL